MMQAIFKLFDIVRERRKTLKKEIKRKMKIAVFFFFFTFTFLQRKKLYFVSKYIWKNLVYTVTFVLQFFHMEGYWKWSNETPTLLSIYIGFVDDVL